MAAPERPISGIAVCVATRDRPEGLARLLDSLTRLDPPSLPVRVVVIDNSPVPSSAPVVESVADRLRIEWFHEPRTGISFARNAALDRLAADEVMEEDEFVLRRAPLERLLQPVVLIFSQGPAPAVEGIRFGFGKPVRINYNKKRIAPVPGKIAFS